MSTLLYKKIFSAALVLGVVFAPLYVVQAGGLQPKTIFIPVIPGGSSVAGYNTSSFIGTVNGLISNGYAVDVYGGTFNSAGYLTSVKTVPFSYNSDAAFNYVNTAVQSSDAQSFVIYGGGHGSPGANGSTEAFGQGNTFANKLNGLNVQDGQTGSIIDQSCFSADRCGMTNLFSEGGPIESFTGASQPNTVASSDALRDVMAHQPMAGDINGDGIMSASELNSIDYEATHYFDGGGSTKIGTETATKNGKDPALFYKKGFSFTECIILRPGQVDNSYTGSANSGDATVEFKPSSVSGYGNRTQDPAAFPILGQIRDTTTTEESELNFDLRKLGSDFVEKHVQKELNSPSGSVGLKKKIVILPTSAQAREFVASLGGNAGAQGSYTINGMKIAAGKHYLSNSPDPKDKIKFDNDCNPSQWTPPSPAPISSQPNSGFNNTGSPGQAGAGSGSGLEGLLPLLMQSLLGGGKGNQNGNTGNNSGNTQTSCSQYGVSPVCGSDGKTYNNSCWLQQMGQVQVSSGVCPTASTSPSPTPDIGKIIAQLVAAGVPQSVIDSIVKSLTIVVGKTTSVDVVVQ